jgi:hypothetical protein
MARYFRVEVANAPAGYQIGPLALVIPFTGMAIKGELQLVAVRLDPDRDIDLSSVEALANTDNATDMKDRDLFPFYQRTRAFAKYLIGDLGKGVRPPNRADVEIAFRYLQAGRELGRRRYLLPDDPDMLTVRDWIKNLSQEPGGREAILAARIAEPGLGANEVNRIVDEIDDLPNNQLAEVYRSLKSLKCAEKQLLLKDFLGYVDGLGQERRKAALISMQVDRPRLESEMNGCVAELGVEAVKQAEVDFDNSLPELPATVEMLERQQASSTEVLSRYPSASYLEEDSSYLGTIAHEISAGYLDGS